MTQQQFLSLAAPFEKTKTRKQIFIASEKVLTGLVYLAYPILVFCLLITRDVRIWRVFFVPAVTFVAVSILRKVINAKRPYEKLQFKPLLPKDKKGESFPSRHVFSVFMIAMAYYYVYIPMGICLTVVGVLLALFRVIGGVHFPKDVLCGAGIGLVLGYIGFFLF